jgi:cell division GTPase FtsZ
MTTTKPYSNFIMHCHLNAGKIDTTHPIQLVEAKSERLKNITPEEANERLASLMTTFNHPNNLIFVEEEDISRALCIDGPAWIASMYANGSDQARNASLACLWHPVLGEATIGASLLSSVTSNEELSAVDFEQVVNQLEGYAQTDTNLKIALHFDQSMQEGMTVNVIATGLASKTTA